MYRKGAIFSDDRVYRYSLWRFWDRSKSGLNGAVVFVGLNPSTADETNDDPTVRRCINYSRDWGFGGLVMLNIFAYRSTDPKNLKQIEDPIGPQNDLTIKNISSHAAVTVAAWGAHGDLLNRGFKVMSLLTRPHYLALTKDGAPRHPLYLRKDLKPIPFEKGTP